MTGITLIRGIDVRACFIGFTRSNHAVMTGLAGAHSLVVINSGSRHPSRAGVTCLAYITSQDMRRALAAGDSAIVTSNARVRRGAVIKRTHKPVGSRVADLTSLCGWYMRRTLTNGDHAIVTTLASTQHLRMID